MLASSMVERRSRAGGDILPGVHIICYDSCMRLFLVRHSETNYNVQKLCNSDPSVDVHLSEKGIEQSNNLSKLLSKVDFEIIYVSELPRTRQTAEIINEKHNLPIQIDTRLNDNKTGFESKPVSEWLTALEDSGDKWNASFNDGESLRQASERATSFLEDLRHKTYSAVLVVTHGFLTQAIFAHLENKTIEEASDFTLLQGTYAEFELI